LQRGKVVKAAGGFFNVRDELGTEYLCRARGALKKGGDALMVGDWVKFTVSSDSVPTFPHGEGVIEERLPRKNRLHRPPVANVDQLIIIMSLKFPECNWQLVSRLLVLAEKEGLASLLCLNKTDLVDDAELRNLAELLDPYPYPVLYTCALSAEGIDPLKGCLSSKCSVFAGPSGVGKSSLLNAIQPGLSLQTAPVSKKIKHGRHTTRQAEILALESGGSVVDTPGFMKIDFAKIEAEELPGLFPEFADLRGHCAFRDCFHLSEPDCAVHRETGKTINPMRYGHYRHFMKELNKQEAY